MNFYSVIRVEMDEHEILRQPGVIARLRRTFGGEPELATGKMRAALDASMLIDAQRRALAEVGAHDAVALVVDDLVLFEDRDRRPDDLGDLFVAFHEYAPVIDADFRVLRLTVEHLEAGVHYVIELQARTEYAKGDSPVRVIISGRMAALEPTKGETADSYRARVEPILQDRVAFQAAQASFDSFVARVRDATARALPSAQVTNPQVSIAPAPATTDRRKREPRPEDRDYDPHDAHYPNPMVGVLGLAMLGMAVMPGMAFASGQTSDGSSSNTEASSDANDDGGDIDDADFDFGSEFGW